MACLQESSGKTNSSSVKLRQQESFIQAEESFIQDLEFTWFGEILFKKNDTKFKFKIKLRALEEASQVRGLDIWLSLASWCGEGNGTQLQYSCLEGPVDGGAWWAAVLGWLTVGQDWVT